MSRNTLKNRAIRIRQNRKTIAILLRKSALQKKKNRTQNQTIKKSITNDRKADVSALFLSAVSLGNLAQVENLVRTYGLSCHECGSEGYVPLFVAIMLGQVKIADFLLLEGAKVLSKTANIVTPLHAAALGGFKELVKKLLDKNVPVDVQDDQNATPLHVAARQGHRKVVQILLKNNASVTTQTSEGETPFFFAVEKRRDKVVRLLFEHAHASFPSMSNAALLNHILPSNPRISHIVNTVVAKIITDDDARSSIVDLLIDHGFTLHSKYVSEALLHKVINENWVKVMECILGRSDHTVCAENYPLLLHKAFKEDDKTIFELLLKSGFNANVRNEYRETCLRKSMDYFDEKKTLKVMRPLLAYGADVNEVPDILHMAIFEGFYEVCKILIENGADVNAPNDKGETPLFLAVTVKNHNSPYFQRGGNNHVDWTTKDNLTKLLLWNGADANGKTKKGYTAFHHAVGSGRRSAVCMLLKFGAEVDLPAEDGTTPLYQAAKSGYTNFIQLFCENNADVNASQTNSKNPLLGAVQAEKTEAVEMLLKFGADIRFDILEALNARTNHLSRKGKRILEIVEQHSVKLEAAELSVSEPYLHLNDQYPSHLEGNHRVESLRQFHQECQAEVNRLKNEILIYDEELNCNPTLYDVLTNGRKPFYAKPKMSEVLKSFNFGSYPIYKNLLTGNLEISKSRLARLKSVQKTLNTLTKTSSVLNGWEHSILPIELVEDYIMSYLSSKEVRNLVNCGKALKRQLRNK